jgi:uncharacterized membrane protein YoaK (UPF0700 family)
MTGVLTEVRETFVPPRDSKDGPLPPLLVAMTVATGLVDAFSFLELGHVFVANVTGNVVFVAFALAGVSGFSIASSLLAIVSFVVGAFTSGALIKRQKNNRGRLLATCSGAQALFLGVATGVVGVSGGNIVAGSLYAVIIPLAFSMGLQNGVARRLAVPDLTTTVLTLTITGLGSDSRAVGGTGSRAGRRLTSVVAMFIGALTGAALVVHGYFALPLAIALSLITAVALSSWRLSRGEGAWLRPS